LSIVFNFKICDNAAECNGISACPVKAIIWDKKQRTLVVDNSKCTSCGSCAKACPVPGAILVAKTKEEFKKLIEQIEDDPRARIELLKDRYGVAPTDFNLIVTMANFNEEILDTDRVVIVDFWDEPHMKCRVFSIPLESMIPKKVVLDEIMKNKKLRNLKFKFRKIDAQKNPEIAKRYSVNTIPTLMIFHNGKSIGRIEGYYKIKDEEKLRKIVEDIIKQIK
jgi:thioredoxin 1